MGRKRKTGQLTPLELEIMKVLWDTGPATVQTVQERLAGERRLAYTTVQTMLNVLHRKGKVKRALKSRAYEYEPVLSREKATSAAGRDMLNRLFGWSAEGHAPGQLSLERPRLRSRRESRRSVRSVRSGRPHRAICRRSQIEPRFRRSRAGGRVIPGCGSARTRAGALARFRFRRFQCMDC